MKFNLILRSRSLCSRTIPPKTGFEDRQDFGLTRGPGFALKAKTFLAFASGEALLKARRRRADPRDPSGRSSSHASGVTFFLFIPHLMSG